MKLSSIQCNPPPIIHYTLYKGGGSNKSLRNNLFCKLMYPGERYARISVYNLKMQKFTKGLVKKQFHWNHPLCIMDYVGGGVVPRNFLEPPPIIHYTNGGGSNKPLEITLFAN